MTNIESLQDDVLDSYDVAELRECEMELQDMAGNLYKAIELAETQLDAIEYKSQLSKVNSLINICKDRQKEVNNENNRVNYNFRVASKKMLTKSTYEEIYAKAKMSRRDFKEIVDTLEKKDS